MLADTGLQLVAAYAGGNFIFDDILPEELARVTRCCRPRRRTGCAASGGGGRGQAV